MKHVVPHHFSSADQAYESSKLGLWVFLVTEILLFGGLFVAYIVFRGLYPESFLEAHHHLNRVMGSINTVVLLFSSLTMALAVDRSKRGDGKKAGWLLLMTLLCGAAFMTIKYFEYMHKIHDGLLPGLMFSNAGITDPHVPLFFSLYFMMTGLHGTHVLVGMGLIAWCLIRTKRGDFSPEYHTPVELTGLFWHLVDLIWIYLFPLLYLIG
ncbi:MAG: cytochrome c oxidase subunit 3 family protein [bacterium]|nr:cytochrome c oxidase subunit 3 family protein [bacterium]